MKSASSIVTAIALCLCLTGCGSWGKTRLSERVALCQQERTAEVPDWPVELVDFPAYALELLGVIEEERRLERVERECQAKL